MLRNEGKTMNKTVLGSIAVSLCIGLSATTVLATGSAGGKNMGAASVSSMVLPASAPLVSASITGGKRKRILVAEGLITSTSNPPGGILTANVDVNGIAMEPQPTGLSIVQDCGFATGTTPFCNFSTSWWLDLDLYPQLHGNREIPRPSASERGADRIEKPKGTRR